MGRITIDPPPSRQRRMTPEKQTEYDIQFDLKLYGIAYTVDGRRVPPHSVVQYTRRKQTEVSGFTLPLKAKK